MISDNKFYGEEKKSNGDMRSNRNVYPKLSNDVIRIEEIKKKVGDWSFRNGKNGQIKSYHLSEDEEFFKEHLEQMAKKQTFDFTNLKNVEFKISYQGKEVTEKIELTKYEDLSDLDERLRQNLKKMNFSQMTPIQRAVIPQMTAGFDVMGCSQTGSGKTVAFLLPIINKMLKEGPPEDSYYRGAAPVALVLIPTRELAEQIFKEARKLTYKTGISVVKAYGAVPKEGQLRELKIGCDILIATPGRLLDFVQSKDISLREVRYMIIDEADRLLDMGFEPQLNRVFYDFDLVEKSKRQNLMFSATFEEEVKGVARKFMNDFYFIHNNSQIRANQNVKQMLIYAKENEKILKLHQILQQIKGSIIIFLDTKKGVDNLFNFLERSNYNVISIHGDKRQWQRQDAIKKFSNGEVPILIATDVASRGLDFPKVSYVFNYDMPSNLDDYIHRIGRTGRCGEKGTAVSFINENNKNIIKPIYTMLKNQNQEIPQFLQDLYSNSTAMPMSSYFSKFQSSSSTENTPNLNNQRNNGSQNDYLNRKRADYSCKPPIQPYSSTGWNSENNLNNMNNSGSSYSGNNYNSNAQGWSSGWNSNPPITTNYGASMNPITPSNQFSQNTNLPKFTYSGTSSGGWNVPNSKTNDNPGTSSNKYTVPSSSWNTEDDFHTLEKAQIKKMRYDI